MQVSLENYKTGANTASDLANTVAGETAEDTLRTSEDLASFALRHGLAVPEVLSADDVQQARRLRTSIREILGGTHSTETVYALNSLLAACRTDVSIELKPAQADRYEWHLAVTDSSMISVRVQALVASGLLTAVRVLGTERFRACEAAFCNGIFVDVTRPGRQRFCNPKRCGNRTHVAAHRARQ